MSWELRLVCAVWLLSAMGWPLEGRAQQLVAVSQAQPEGVQVSEWDGMTHVVAADAKQLRLCLEQSPGWLPWDPMFFFDSSVIVWTDFQKLPPEIAKLSEQQGQERYGVTFRGLQVRVNITPPEEELWWQWAFTWTWAADKWAEERYTQLVCGRFGLKELPPQAYSKLLLDPRNWWLKPRLLTLSVWVGDLADQETYAKNIAAEIAAWEEEERQLQSTVKTGTEQTLIRSAAASSGGQTMSLLLLGGGCPITNDAAPFGVALNAETNGAMTVTWESCTTHLYGVLTKEDMASTNRWAAQLWMIGQDGTSSWTDTNAAPLTARFYKVRRLTLDGDDDDGDGLSNADEFNTYGTDPGNPDTDGDGMPDGWEVQYGFNPLNPSDGSGDSDGDGVSNAVEYVQGRDPTKGAVSDGMGLVNLEVFTPME